MNIPNSGHTAGAVPGLVPGTNPQNAETASTSFANLISMLAGPVEVTTVPAPLAVTYDPNLIARALIQSMLAAMPESQPMPGEPVQPTTSGAQTEPTVTPATDAKEIKPADAKSPAAKAAPTDNKTPTESKAPGDALPQIALALPATILVQAPVPAAAETLPSAAVVLSPARPGDVRTTATAQVRSAESTLAFGLRLMDNAATNESPGVTKPAGQEPPAPAKAFCVPLENAELFQPTRGESALPSSIESKPESNTPAPPKSAEPAPTPSAPSIRNQPPPAKAAENRNAPAGEPQIAARMVPAPQFAWARTDGLSVQPQSVSAGTSTASADSQQSGAAAMREPPAAAFANPAEKSATAQEIAVHIARPEAPSVDVLMTEREGQVHVAVRTADTSLQTTLRQDLGTLVRSLERSGFQTETFMPSPAPRLSSAAPADSGYSSHGDSSAFGRRDEHRRGSQQQPRHKAPAPITLEEIEPMEHAA